MPAKVLLFLVEGTSDIRALEYPLGMFFCDINSSFELRFLKPVDNKGDITGNNLIEQSKIAKSIDKWWGVSNSLSRNGFEPSDVAEIIQIIDIDGVYIANESIKYGPFREKIEYCETEIKCENPNRVIDRNLRKRHNISSLKKTVSLRIGSTNIPYSIYYFSCNLDHFLFGERNLNHKLKCDNAETFAYSFDNSSEVYSFFETSNEERTSVQFPYKKSWEYLKKESNSLSACSNLILLLDKYKIK